jgi:hypothetical protein
MHFNIYVIGPDPVERVGRIETEYGAPDWCGIGGRYTGSLIPVPGATSGIVFGDTLPAFEASVVTQLMQGWGVVLTRPAHQGAGVDQIARRDLDIEATIVTMMPRYVLDAVGGLHSLGLTPSEDAAATVMELGSLRPGAVTEAEVRAVHDKREAWERRWRALIAAADPDALITVVDIHV